MFGQFCPSVLLVRERAGQVCLDTILESEGLGTMPLSRVYLELLGFLHRTLSLVRLERRLVRKMEGLLGWVSGVHGLALSLVLAW